MLLPLETQVQVTRLLCVTTWPSNYIHTILLSHSATLIAMKYREFSQRLQLRLLTTSRNGI